MNRLEELQDYLFATLSKQVGLPDVPVVFILGAPRTGSTLFYQLLVRTYDFFYFSNLINDAFSTTPIVGAVLQGQMAAPESIGFHSQKGKTKGLWGPSEASFVFRYWFGGQHPSETFSRRLLPGRREHFEKTMEAVFALTSSPILTKNAWNCFRVKALTEIFRKVAFIWIRRDLRDSALSDLQCRYDSGGPTTWNSATTANCEEIRKLPYWEQVVEQQYSYMTAISSSLELHANRTHTQIWYEDLCSDPAGELTRIEQCLRSSGVPISQVEPLRLTLTPSSGPDEIPEDRERIDRYVAENLERFGPCLCSARREPLVNANQGLRHE